MIGIAYGYLVRHGGIGRYIEQTARRMDRGMPSTLLFIEKDIITPPEIVSEQVSCDRNRSFMDFSENRSFSEELRRRKGQYALLHLHGLYDVKPDLYTAHICIAEYLDRNKEASGRTYDHLDPYLSLERQLVEDPVVRVAAASRKVADDLSARYGRHDIVILPAASRVPIVEKRFSSKESLTLGFVGGNLHEKGIATLIAAVKELRGLGYEARCLGAGCSPEVYAAFADADVPATLFGHQDIDASFYDRMDQFVCLSPYEGFSMSALEAMARSVPVIGSEDQGVFYEHPLPETMIAKVTDVGQVTEKVIALHQDKSLWAEATRKGRAVALAYDWDRTAQAQTRLYRELLGSG